MNKRSRDADPGGVITHSNTYTSSDNVYYDIIVTNITSYGENNTYDVPPVLSFTENRTSAFLYNPHEYTFSVIRFNLDTPSLPVFCPTIVPDQTNINQTVYKIGLSFFPNTGTGPLTEQTNLDYDVIAPVAYPILPLPPSSTANKLQDNSSGYYYVYSLNQVAQLVSEGLQTCWTGLLAQCVQAGFPLPGYCPTCEYNPSTQSFSITADVETLGAGYFAFSCNADFYSLFPSFPFQLVSSSAGLEYLFPKANGTVGYFGFNDLSTYKTVSLPMSKLPPNVHKPISFAGVSAVQEYSTLSLLSPVMSVVFTSNDIPVVQNNISSPLLFYQNKNVTTGSVSGITNSIITDFTVDGLYNPSITYTPTSQYREINLIGDRPLNSININVYWQNTLGELVPFRLLSGATASVKLLFSK
jgi:hypothetical protein